MLEAICTQSKLSIIATGKLNLSARNLVLFAAPASGATNIVFSFVMLLSAPDSSL